MPYLYDTFNNPFARKIISEVEIPTSIKDNLKYELRPYQEDAFKRFLYYVNNEFEGKQSMPYHLLFNMATGS